MALVAIALESPELTRAHVRPALAGAQKVNNPEIIALIEKKLATMPAEAPTAGVNVDRSTLQSYVGSSSTVPTVSRSSRKPAASR